VSRRPRAIQKGEELSGRLFRSDDLSEALSIFFDTVLSPEGVEQAAVLVPREGELVGIAAMGWQEGDVRRISVPLDGDDPIAAAYRSGEPGPVPPPVELDRPAGDCIALPLASIDPRSPPFGLLLLVRRGPGGDLPGSFLQRVGSIAPILVQIGERNHLLRSRSDLERQRDLLRALVDALPDPVLITDAQNTVILENQRAETLFTASEGDSAGRCRAIEINNLLFSSFLTRSVIGGDPAPGRELNLVDPSEGADLLFEVLSTPLPAGLWSEPANVSVLRDVTDLKMAATELEQQFNRLRQAEVKSRRERDRLNMILENVGDPILVTDAESNIILMNREAERLFDAPSASPPRSRVRRDIRANDTKFSSFISEFSLSQDEARAARFELTHPDSGAGYPAEVISGKVFDDRGELTAIVSVLHDLTNSVENERLATELGKLNASLEDRIRAATLELEERNRQLEWQRQELERAYQLKSQFLASMSHELRTPINALLGYAALLRDHIYGELNQRQDEALARMYRASQHLLELVNDILDLAKIEAGKMPVHVESVDIRKLIMELSQTIEPLVRRKSLAYEVELDRTIPVIRTDPTKVKQILLNLLSNAVKFTQTGRIRVRARPAVGDSGVVIEVIDSGIGIRSEDIVKIFDDFRQVDQSSTREYGGTGLGLSITKKLLSLLGGTVRVESVFGKGSVFTVWLPLESREIVLDGETIGTSARNALP